MFGLWRGFFWTDTHRSCLRDGLHKNKGIVGGILDRNWDIVPPRGLYGCVAPSFMPYNIILSTYLEIGIRARRLAVRWLK